MKSKSSQSDPELAEIVTVRSQTASMTVQNLPYFVGISEKTAGARHLSMSLVVVPPGARSEPHLHIGYETAIYVLEGEVETRYGPGLEKSVINHSGDFLLIPSGLPHQSINCSQTQPARAIIARNDAREQEKVVPYSSARG